MSPAGAYEHTANLGPNAQKSGARAGVSGAEAEQLVLRHAELVKRIAHHLAGRLPASVEVDDLIQAGMLGLLEAASSYAADRGASFETYAGIRIRGAMIDSLRKLDWAPRSVHRRARDAATAIRSVEHRLGREARDAEVAAEMGIEVDEYHKVMQDAAACQLTSLEDAGAAGDAADGSLDPFADAHDGDFRLALADAISQLPERERLVMSLYYDEELNLKEIGLVLKVSESRVCQLHGQALTRLKARLAGWREKGT